MTHPYVHVTIETDTMTIQYRLDPASVLFERQQSEPEGFRDDPLTCAFEAPRLIVGGQAVRDDDGKYLFVQEKRDDLV